MRFHAKKMQEYCEIAPENDPCDRVRTRVLSEGQKRYIYSFSVRKLYYIYRYVFIISYLSLLSDNSLY